MLENYFLHLFFGVTLGADIAAMLHPRHSYNNNNLKQFCNFHQSNITRWIRLIRNLNWQDWRHHVSICEHLVMIIERKHCKCTVAKNLLVSRFLRNMSIAAADQSGHCISPMFQVRFGKIGYWQLWVSLDNSPDTTQIWATSECTQIVRWMELKQLLSAWFLTNQTSCYSALYK